MDKLDFIKMKTFCFVKDIKRMESYRCGGKYFQIIYPTKDLYLEKSQNSIVGKQTTQLKVRRISCYSLILIILKTKVVV